MALKLGNFQSSKMSSNPSIQIPDEALATYPIYSLLVVKLLIHDLQYFISFYIL